MAKFDVGETAVCSIEVRDMDGVLKNPATSMTITITNPSGTKVVDTQSMGTPDSTGKYHYDYTSAESAIAGEYNVLYVATDGSRIAKQTDKFQLEAV